MGDSQTGGSDTSSRPDPLVGRRLASYEVLARVARGGMGVVYRARHVYIDKIVALKVLDPALAQRADLIERFRTEAQSLARVEHENVVKVIDILEDKGVHFIVMDFAEGVNLRQYVKDHGPLSAEVLLSVARQTAEALYAAHREGILHRDIKPENLIMNSRGRCKLADFGLAGDLRLIKEGHEGPLNFGTPAYSAPEVMRRLVPNKRSDIFSYGATLYFLATGEPPFGQTGASAIMLRQQQGAELLHGRRPDLPDKLNQLVMDCINNHPKDRPADFIEVLDALPRRILTRRMQAATEPTDPLAMATGTSETLEDAPPTGNRLAVIAAACALAAVVLVASLWIGSIFGGGAGDNTIAANNTEAPRSNRPMPANNTPANKPPDDIPAFKPEDEAFNAAELDSRAALSNLDYKAAVAAWSAFMAAYPESPHVRTARDRQVEIILRVADLRSVEYDRAKQASDEALRESRTGDALAAIERFPAELLVPLTDSDDVAVSRRLDIQRDNVLATEESDLKRVLERADELRNDWLRNLQETDPARRARTAGNLLAERELIEGFLPGRIVETQLKLEERLGEVRKLLDGLHQAAVASRDNWRRFHDDTLGQWAADALKAIETARAAAASRDPKQALRELDAAEKALADARTQAAREARQGADVRQEALALRMEKSEFVALQLRQYRTDILLIERLGTLLDSAVRELRGNGTVREYQVHTQDGPDGELLPATEKYTGRVVAVGANDFVIESGGVRTTIQFKRLAVDSVRRIVSNTDNLDDQLALIAWLVVNNAVADAETELQRIARLERAPEPLLARARAMIEAGRLAPTAVGNLAYVAARTGRSAAAGLVVGELPRRLAAAQLGVLDGDKTAATEYLKAVSETVDPELVHLETFARALSLTEPGVADLRNWVLLEPQNPAAFVALAEWLKADGKVVEATLHAGTALSLDGSNEAAWRLRLR